MMAQPASLTVATTAHHEIVATRYRRALVVLVAVVGLHLALLAWTLAARDRTIERINEPRTMTALLLSPTPEPVAPTASLTPAVRSDAMPVPAPLAAAPVRRARPVAQFHPQARRDDDAVPSPTLSPTPLSTPSAQPANTAPSQAMPTSSAPSTPRTAQPATRADTASAEPKTVSHVDCDIAKPDYPDISQRRGEAGTAVVRFVVGVSGRIEAVQLLKGSGYPRLDAAALDAVHTGVCRPYGESGAAVRVAYSQSFVFGLTP